MRYLVVLDTSSPVGNHYAAGSNDGFVADGNLRHPALDCTEISPETPHYLLVKRDMSKHSGGQQTIYVPHRCVAFIVGYADEGPKPMGFVSSSPAA